jgi:acetyl esterase/lipase
MLNQLGPKSLKAIGAIVGAGFISLSAMVIAAPTMAQPISIEALAKFEGMTSVRLSPDGKKLAAIISVPGQKWPVISIWDADDLSKTPVWIPSATNRITSVSFFSNDQVLFDTEQEITRLDGRLSFTTKFYIASVDGKKIVEPFRPTGTKSKEIREQLARGDSFSIFKDNLYNPDIVLLSKLNPDTLINEIVEYNKKTGQSRVTAAESDKWGFVSSGVDLATGDVRIRQAVKVSGSEGKFYLVTEVKDKDTGEWVEHPLLGYRLEDRLTLNIQGFDEDTNKIFVVTNRGRNFAAVYSYDLKTKTYSPEPLYANEKFDILSAGLKQDYENKRFDYISSLTVAGPSIIQVLFDEKWEPVQKAIQAAFPGKFVRMSINRASDKAVVSVEADDFPTEYYLYANGKLSKLGGQRPWIKPETLGKTEFITYKARDGLEIPAIVTYPPNWTKAKGPISAIVHPHGGPWARDYMGWDQSGWTQFLATRNIAVIRPQYRGSDDLGAKLWKAGDNEWGQKMQDDNDDAAAYLVSQGIADPKRIAIFGYSYGGFAAIAASVRPNSPYRCAIAGAGVASLERLGNLWGDNRIQREIQGHTVKGMDPMKNIRGGTIPIMLYHGDRDRQADTDHSRMFYKAAKAAGRDVQYTEIKDMWHTLPWRPEWHTQSLTLIENYLKSDKCGIL